MNRIPQPFIDDLLNRIDIVEVIDTRVKLKKNGKNYSACCPFHEEKTPSFTVSPDKQFYYCFGCGATGNSLGFLMDYERQSFVDAIETLARSAGVDVPREAPSAKSLAYSKKQKNIYDLLAQAENFYKEQLKSHSSSERPVHYLKNRGLSGHIARDFGLGYAPQGWDNLLKKLGTTETDTELLVDGGMVIRKQEEQKIYDRFRDRIMFPIHDARGRTIGFGGRVLGDDKPKYLNSPETTVFQKGRELYGLYEARKANRNLERLIIVEGYMDVIALAQFGLTHAVATLGTACGEDHLKLAFRHVSEVVFCFDGDKAGRNAAKRALVNSLTAMEDGKHIRFLFLAEGQDPDSLVRQIGPERFSEQIKNATPLEDYLFDVCAEQADVSTMEGRAKLTKLAAPMLNMLPSGVFRELMFNQLAKRTGLSLDTIMDLTAEPILEVAPDTREHEHTHTQQPDDTHQYAPDYASYNLPHSQLNVERTPNHTAPNNLQPNYFEPNRLPRKAKPVRSSIHTNPARLATTLLLEFPTILEQIQTIPKKVATEDEDLRRLFHLLDYLKTQQNATFSRILGFWGGKYGVEEQQKLAALLANKLVISAKELTQYNPLDELTQCLDNINKHLLTSKAKQELDTLKNKGLGNLNDEEKERFRFLISQQRK